jgi:hypothetical protein
MQSNEHLPDEAQVRHMMICNDEQAIVIEDGFFTPTLSRLDHGRNKTYGVCLEGGVLFEDRSELRVSRATRE